MSGVGDLALWLSLRMPRGETPPRFAPPPPGEPPLILIHGAGRTPGGAPAARAVAAALTDAPQGVRLAPLGPEAAAALPDTIPVPADLPADLSGARALLGALAPAALVVFGKTLPAALVAAAHDMGVPTTVVAPRAPVGGEGGWWSSALPRRLLHRVSRLILTDPDSRDEALRQGLPPARVRLVTGLEVSFPPPRVNPREYAALQALIRGRHVWLAAALPQSEADAVLAAQEAVLTYNHRALLIVAPADLRAVEPLAAAIEARGLTLARRDWDEEPSPDIQVYLADDTAELGLWYRLASVSFLGGTLLGGGDAAPRSPLEPAALGSAIIHGSRLADHPLDWQRLRRGSATRQVASAAGLASAAADLTAADQAAVLAQAAWNVSTAGAAAAQQIARLILDDLTLREAAPT